MKYAILRALDVAGLKVLEPIVRLCCGEEPTVQIRKIGLFICIPILTFAVFLSIWSYVGPRHKTKSGEVPGPSRVVEAWDGIVQFARRENQKATDFMSRKTRREKALASVEAEFVEVEKYAELSKSRFDMLEAKRGEVLSKNWHPIRLRWK